MHTYLFPAQCCLPVCCVFLFDVIYLSGFGHVSVCVKAERRVEGVSCVIFTTLALIFRMRSAQLARVLYEKSEKFKLLGTHPRVVVASNVGTLHNKLAIGNI